MDAGMLLKLVLLLFLAGAAIMDVREQKIPLVYIAGGFAAGVILQLITREMKFYEVAGGCLLGGTLVLAAFLSRQEIGYGDGLMFAATGGFLGFVRNLTLMLTSFLLVFLCAGILLILKKKRHFRIPFVPFVFAGFLLILVLY